MSPYPRRPREPETLPDPLLLSLPAFLASSGLVPDPEVLPEEEPLSSDRQGRPVGHKGHGGREGQVSIEVLVPLLAEKTMVAHSSSTYGVPPRQVAMMLSSTDVIVIVCVLMETTDIVCPAPPA